jgi:CTP-dependent riboflavin kinase
MLTGTVATALKKEKLFRSELDHRFGFTPFYGTVQISVADP